MYIKTLGVYKSTLTAGPFDFEVYDVGGSRAGQKKWVHCMTDLDSVVWVVDLNGYCRYLQEDIDAVCQPSSQSYSILNTVRCRTK